MGLWVGLVRVGVQPLPARLHVRPTVKLPAVSALDRLVLDILKIPDNLFAGLIILVIILFLDHFSSEVLSPRPLLARLLHLHETAHSLHKFVTIFQHR